MKLNRMEKLKTHEGAKASRINPEQQLRRSIMACLLWENQFYEEGQSIADRVASLVPKVAPDKVAEMAIEAREKMKLRHMPLYLVSLMATLPNPKHLCLVGNTLSRIIQRADELTEFLAIYWKNGKKPLSAQIKKGLAFAFSKFDEYQFSKYDHVGAEIKLRDVMFLVHPKPPEGKEELYRRIANKELRPPNTWESSLVGGADKRQTFERLLKENRIGGMALLRNLRNMKESGVKEDLVLSGLANMRTDRILPFRFVAAAKYAPQWESQIEQAMLKSLSQVSKLPGKTILIVDVSGSMYGAHISKRSELDRAEVACALAIFVREMCEHSAIYATAGNDLTRVHATKQVPTRKGFALSDAIYKMCHPLGGGGIFLRQVMDYVFEREKEAERIIVITDEQDCDIAGSPAKAHAFGRHNYLINVASYQNGIGYDKWTHIDGWSEAILEYIKETERVTKEEAGQENR